MIGGGPAAMTAAFFLTRNDPDAYDITIYEMSWRLGGKTASGRGPGGRIEEHGLHILFGCYHNVFKMLLSCYDELREKKLVGPEKHRFQHFHDAITPHHFGVIGDDRTKPWRPTYIRFPTNRGVPGDPPLSTFYDLCLTGIQLLWLIVIGGTSLAQVQRAAAPIFGYKPRWLARHFRKRKWDVAPKGDEPDDLGGDFLSRLVMRVLLGLLDRDKLAGSVAATAAAKLQRALHRVHPLAFTDSLSRMWSSTDFVLALFRGISADGLSKPGGFREIDKFDLRTWLNRHGASTETLGSPWMRVIYDAAFSYPNGGLRPPGAEQPPGLSEQSAYEQVGAGAALRALMLMTFTYKGAFYNKMEAGMSDVFYTPLYLVLKSRGVKFEFFHRLKDVALGGDETSRRVDQLEFYTLPTRQEYDPLVGVKDLLCWPARPNLDQLHEENRAWASQAETYAPDECAHSTRTLTRGKDFDVAVLGIPVACLPYACSSLLAAETARNDRPFPSFVDQAQIDVVQTVALQLWMKPTLRELGWKEESPLLSLFADPLNTWCDMTHLLPREPWKPDEVAPRSLAYFCGALPHLNLFPPANALARTPAVRQAIEAQVREVSLELLEKHMRELWPTVTSLGGFDFNLLLDPHNRRGRARLNAHYMRANYEPHALCTLALPGKTVFRMKAERTGYDNLFVTGDWIDNDVHLACVEGAVHSGIRTAREVARKFGGNPERYRIVAEGLLGLEVLSSKPHAQAGTAAARSEQRTA